MTKKLPTIDIKGKAYVLVKDRLIAFQELYPHGSIQTEKYENGDIIVFKATVVPDVTETPQRVFTGHSEAIRGHSQGITGQSPVEVAETSAVGRALAMLGIGVIESVASADEVVHAQARGRSASEKQKNYIKELVEKKGKPMPDQEWFDSLTAETASKAIDKLMVVARTRGANEQDDKTDVEGERESYISSSGFQE